MSEPSNTKAPGSFAQAFLPGLILGLVIGAVAGAFLPDWFGGSNIPAGEVTPGTPATPGDRDGIPQDDRDAIDDLIEDQRPADPTDPTDNPPAEIPPTDTP